MYTNINGLSTERTLNSAGPTPSDPKSDSKDLGDQYSPSDNTAHHPFGFTSEELSDQLVPGQEADENTVTPEAPQTEGTDFPRAYALGKSQYKPVGGSGWLDSYTNFKSTKNGSVEYPKIKEGTRSLDNPKHWYWRFCWYKKSPKGKTVRRNGKPVVSSIGCPQKKVRAVERAIASKLPHDQILEIIKGGSTPPPT